jgi:hypothetical protein
MSIKVGRSEPPLAPFYVGPQPWMKYRACADMPMSMFFDDVEQRDYAAKLKATRLARAVCSLCPVRKDCATQAMVEEGSAPHGRYGYRGCLTPQQRRRLYRQGGLGNKDPKRIPISG